MTPARAASHVRPVARVSVEPTPLWRLQASRAVPRWLIAGMALAGLAASARFAIAPPRPGTRTAGSRAPAPVDRAAEAFADQFARRYLTWNGADPETNSRALEGFFGPGFEPGAGVELPSTGAQAVAWVEVAQSAEPERGLHVYTVAAQLDPGAVVYLAVRVTRTPAGSLALAGYPAIVGPPASAGAIAARPRREVEDSSLVLVLQRALRNYLAGSAAELAADLALGAHISTPSLHLSLESMQRPYWARPGVVLAIVQARDGRGLQLTLAYEVAVSHRQGRWEIATVQAGSAR
jgi:conjugative transposon protein TcpC